VTAGGNKSKSIYQGPGSGLGAFTRRSGSGFVLAVLVAPSGGRFCPGSRCWPGRFLVAFWVALGTAPGAGDVNRGRPGVSRSIR